MSGPQKGFHFIMHIMAYNTQCFSENFKVFMLRTIMSNDQLKHLKAAFNQVLREKDPEQVN